MRRRPCFHLVRREDLHSGNDKLYARDAEDLPEGSRTHSQRI